MKTEIHRGEVPRKVRTNMFVMATIFAGSGSAPVRIRDLSPDGALIEGGVLPHPGSRVRLVRGDLVISGQVVWMRGARAGLHFDAIANVADWLPSARRPSQQSRVDAIVHGIPDLSFSTPKAVIEPRPSQTDANEILRVRAMLELLGEELAGDIDVITRHGSKLQTLDLAAQLLAKLAMKTT